MTWIHRYYEKNLNGGIKKQNRPAYGKKHIIMLNIS